MEEVCRQAHALTYLGDADTRRCDVCDLCRGARPLGAADLSHPHWRTTFDPTAISDLARLTPDAIAIARALCQVTTARSRPYRRHPAWGRLERAPYREVLALVEQELARSAVPR